MTPLTLTINGQETTAPAEPRTHLGDFIRETAGLTGTHLGCEHGVCGACTVLLDGKPVRSCITFAVACESREITTVEGYDEDPVMALLRPAFTKHHALQCGYCTPGMLASARDIVLRLPNADELKIRTELAGNLCRCTGYLGIVDAIQDVLTELKASPDQAIESMRKQLASKPPEATQKAAFTPFEALAEAPVGVTNTVAPSTASDNNSDASKGTSIDGVFEVPHPADKVWAFMGDLPAVAACLPGASIDSHEQDRVNGRVAIKFGPMSAAFVGAARLERNEETMTAVLRGAGKDSLSQSRANGDVSYRVESLSADSSRVTVDLLYSLQGPLAQFSRSGLVRDFVRRMIVDFGKNVTARLDGNTEPLPAASSSSALQAVLGILIERVRNLFRKR